MLLFWSTIRQGIDGFMEWKPRMKWLMLLKNGTATLPIYEPSINWLYLFGTMPEKKPSHEQVLLISSVHEQWQNRPAEASINSIMQLARTVMAVSCESDVYPSSRGVCQAVLLVNSRPTKQYWCAGSLLSSQGNDTAVAIHLGLHKIYSKGSNLLSLQLHPYTGMMRW